MPLPKLGEKVFLPSLNILANSSMDKLLPDFTISSNESLAIVDMTLCPLFAASLPTSTMSVDFPPNASIKFFLVDFENFFVIFFIVFASVTPSAEVTPCADSINVSAKFEDSFCNFILSLRNFNVLLTIFLLFKILLFSNFSLSALILFIFSNLDLANFVLCPRVAISSSNPFELATPAITDRVKKFLNTCPSLSKVVIAFGPMAFATLF